METNKQPPRELIEELEAAGMTVLYQQNDQQCDLCGEIAELRPYGPNGKAICWDYGNSSPEMRSARDRQAREVLGL